MKADNTWTRRKDNDRDNQWQLICHSIQGWIEFDQPMQFGPEIRSRWAIRRWTPSTRGKFVKSLWSGRVLALLIGICKFDGRAKNVLVTEWKRRSHARTVHNCYLAYWKCCGDVEVPLGRVCEEGVVPCTQRWLVYPPLKWWQLLCHFWLLRNEKRGMRELTMGCQEKMAYFWGVLSIRKSYSDTLFMLS